MEKYLEGEELTVEELEAAIRRATLADKINPVLCGTAFKNKGVQPLLDAVVKYLPSPLDIDGIKGHAANDEDEVIVRQPSDDEPFSGLAYKIATDPHLGKLIYVRRLLRQARGRLDRAELGQRAARSGSARSTRCTRTSVRRSRRSAPARSWPSWV